METRDNRDRDNRDLYNGFGDTLARSLELVACPLLFAFFGHLLDRWLGISPVLAIAFAGFALLGEFVRFYYAYDQKMRAHDAAAPWGKKAV